MGKRTFCLFYVTSLNAGYKSYFCTLNTCAINISYKHTTQRNGSNYLLKDRNSYVYLYVGLYNIKNSFVVP